MSSLGIESILGLVRGVRGTMPRCYCIRLENGDVVEAAEDSHIGALALAKFGATKEKGRICGNLSVKQQQLNRHWH